MSMTEIINKHWKFYLMEAAGLAGFVILAGAIFTYFENPHLPVMNSWMRFHPFLRKLPLAFILGIYVWIATLLMGKQSGAHMNPAVTWTFYRTKNINLTDAVFYTIAQFAGAVAGAWLLTFLLGGYFSQPLIDYGVTKPKPQYGAEIAFIAEFIISFILMGFILYFNSYKSLEKFSAMVTGILLTLFLIFEIQYSGMSLNPARSFAGSFAANEWKVLWVYFVAPPLAMLAAVEIFRFCLKQNIFKKNEHYQDIPCYPFET